MRNRSLRPDLRFAQRNVSRKSSLVLQQTQCHEECQVDMLICKEIQGPKKTSMLYCIFCVDELSSTEILRNAKKNHGFVPL